MKRIPDHPVLPLILERWSPRAYTDQSLDQPTLMGLLEGARWAPSASNTQPWRFAYALRHDAHWAAFMGLLAPGNALWCGQAAALLLLASTRSAVLPGKTEPGPLPTHSFDCGAAWMALALQANSLGWHTHAMVGFDKTRARTELHIPEDLNVEAMIAIGKIGDPASLPEALKAREEPNTRRPMTELVFAGPFTAG